MARERAERPDEIRQLADRLRQLRVNAGFRNSDDFAFEHGLNRAQYGKYEAGRDLQYTTLVKLVRLHGLTLKEFFAEGFD